MRKVTASAVILTALTGCGQNSGIHSNQWSFEVPAEDDISGLELSQDAMTASSAGDAAMTEGSLMLADERDAGTSSTVANSPFANGMMGPAFEQPGMRSKASVANALSANASASSSANFKVGYQPLAARPDPVAQAKAFLSSSGSPSALTNREPYLSSVVMPSLSAVSLPAPSPGVATTVSNSVGAGPVAFSTDISNNGSFTNAGLPVIDSSSRASYSTDDFASSAASVSLGQSPLYQSSLYQSPLADSQASFATAMGSSDAFRSPDLSNADLSNTDLSATNLASSQKPAGMVSLASLPGDGLPTLESRETDSVPIGTAILQNLQSVEVARSENVKPAQDLLAEGNEAGAKVEGSLISDTFEDVDDAYSTAADYEEVETSATGNFMADSLPYSTVEQDTVGQDTVGQDIARQTVLFPGTYISQDSDANVAIESAAYSPSISNFPTLESLLETMPETAAQPNFVVETPNLSDNSIVSPLLEGLNRGGSSREGLGDSKTVSTLYTPVPESPVGERAANAIGSSANSSVSSSANLVESSIASLSKLVPDVGIQEDSLVGVLGSSAVKIAGLRSDRVKSALSLVDKPDLKRRQLMTY